MRAGPVATITRSVWSIAASVEIPVTRFPFTSTCFASQPSRKTTPARRAASAIAVVAPSGSSV